jgi:hypothetical protein
MTTTNKTSNLLSPSSSDTPGDIPTARPPALARLDGLLGEWEMEAVFGADYFAPGSPPLTARGGRTTFDWLEGDFFLIQRFAVDDPAAPSGIAIIGVEADLETFTQHYYDSRGVARDYRMVVEDGIWKLWRDAPGFWQRYDGVFSSDGTTIAGAWEGSSDGKAWKHDFELNYTKVG